MPIVPIILPANVAPTGLLTLVAKVYNSATDELAATVAMTEVPASSTRYKGAFDSPASAATYDVSIIDGGAARYGTEQIQTDDAGNEITLANSSGGSATVTYAQAAAAFDLPAATAMSIAVLRGDTTSFALTGLGSLASRTQLFLTIKTASAYLHAADSASVLQLEETAGLLFLNGERVESSDGSLTVTDQTAGEITIALDASASGLLPLGDDFVYDVQMIDGATVTTLANGKFTVLPDVTRAI